LLRETAPNSSLAPARATLTAPLIAAASTAVYVLVPSSPKLVMAAVVTATPSPTIAPPRLSSLGKAKLHLRPRPRQLPLGRHHLQQAPSSLPVLATATPTVLPHAAASTVVFALGPSLLKLAMAVVVTATPSPTIVPPRPS
jgi:hypothetical protein